MQEHLAALVDSGPWSAWKDRPGGIFLLRGDGLADADRVLLEAVAACRPRRRSRRARRNSSIGPRRRRRRPTMPIPQRRSPGPTARPRSSPAVADDGERRSAGSPAAAASTSSCLTGDARRPRPGRTCWPTASSARSSRRRAPRSPGPGNSRENRLTPFANDPVVRSDGGGDLPARRGQRRGLGRHAGPAAAIADAAAGWSATRAGVTQLRHAAARDLRQQLEVFVVPCRAGEGVGADADQHVPASPRR